MPLVRIMLRRQFGINKEELWKEYEEKGTVGGIKPANAQAARHLSTVIARRKMQEGENDAIAERFKSENNK